MAVLYPSDLPENTDAELQAFDSVCEQLAGFNARLGFEYVDGWLTGLATTPLLPQPGEWLPMMCIDAFERAFADPDDAARAERALTTRLAVLRRQLDPEAVVERPDELRLFPSLAEWERSDDSDDAKPPPEPATFWAMGVLDAIKALEPRWPPVPTEDQGALEEMIEQVDLLINLDGIDIPGVEPDPEGEDHATRLRRYWPDHEPTRDEMIGMACLSLQALRLFLAEHMPPPEQRRVDATPGRNDPCPCGSGKKYKKCHGAVA